MNRENKGGDLPVTLVSFGYKYGLPEDLNMLVDVRFLLNPYWVEELRPGSGQDRKVSEFILSSEQGREFVVKLVDMLNFLIDQYSASGKGELVVCIGCTGGRHRSVAVVEALSQQLSKAVLVKHRDIEKDLQV